MAWRFFWHHAQVAAVDIVDEQTIDKFVSLIEIYGAHHSLESIAVDMLLREVAARIANHVRIETNAVRDAVERLARYDLRTQLRHEALVAIGKLDEEIVRRNALDNGVAQKFETFIIDLLSAVEHDRCRLVDQSQLVELDIVRHESEHVVDGGIVAAVATETSAERA